MVHSVDTPPQMIKMKNTPDILNKEHTNDECLLLNTASNAPLNQQ